MLGLSGRSRFGGPGLSERPHPFTNEKGQREADPVHNSVSRKCETLAVQSESLHMVPAKCLVIVVLTVGRGRYFPSVKLPHGRVLSLGIVLLVPGIGASRLVLGKSGRSPFLP